MATQLEAVNGAQIPPARAQKVGLNVEGVLVTQDLSAAAVGFNQIRIHKGYSAAADDKSHACYGIACEGERCVTPLPELSLRLASRAQVSCDS